MYRKYFKRVFDFIFALLLMPVVLLVIVIFGSLIKLEDRGSVFYFGERLGKNGEPFKMYKLRSMKVNAPDIRKEDGSTYNSADDLRLTIVGKFIRKTSVDEIPQIINVLVGDMSFVGPRPDLVDQKSMYVGDEIRKLAAVPGITGYNQAYFRNSIPVKERFKNDIYYVDNISLLFDLKIVVKTFTAIFLRENVFINDNKISKQ